MLLINHHIKLNMTITMKLLCKRFDVILHGDCQLFNLNLNYFNLK